MRRPSSWTPFFVICLRCSHLRVNPFSPYSSLSFRFTGTRSPPPHLRDPSPPRRYSQTLEPIEREVPTAPRQRTRSDRPASPVRPVEPYSDVPQRRPRDYDPEYENDIKRRRIDDVDSRSDLYRRAASPERRSPLSIDRPTSASQAPADSSRTPSSCDTLFVHSFDCRRSSKTSTPPPSERSLPRGCKGACDGGIGALHHFSCSAERVVYFSCGLIFDIQRSSLRGPAIRPSRSGFWPASSRIQS